MGRKPNAETPLEITIKTRNKSATGLARRFTMC